MSSNQVRGEIAELPCIGAAGILHPALLCIGG